MSDIVSKTHNLNGRNTLLTFFLLICLLSLDGVAQTNNPIEVVIHPNVSINPHMTRNSLRAIFGMRLSTWQHGESIKVYVMPDDHPLHQRFVKEKLNVFPYQLRSAWDRLIFSGTGQAPITVSSQEEMYAQITSTPGAIGYLIKEVIDDKIQVLRIK